MSKLLDDIKTSNWQISTAGVGVIAEGLADIRQCLDIILSTSKLSDPLRPEFGSDIFQHISKPMNVAIPNVIKSIIEAVEIWEKRVTIKEIKWELLSSHQAKFYITYNLVDEELIDLLIYYMNGGYTNYDPVVDVTHLTLYGLFPPNPANKRYIIGFAANGNDALPRAPEGGFANVNIMYNWVVANWGSFGNWLLASDRIILEANPNITSGMITVRLTGILRFAAAIPVLGIGQQYELQFSPDGNPYPVEYFNTMAEMLAFVQANYTVGTWDIEGSAGAGGDFDIQDFNEDDFFIGTPSSYYLVLYSQTVSTCVLNIAAV